MDLLPQMKKRRSCTYFPKKRIGPVGYLGELLRLLETTQPCTKFNSTQCTVASFLAELHAAFISTYTVQFGWMLHKATEAKLLVWPWLYQSEDKKISWWRYTAFFKKRPYQVCVTFQRWEFWENNACGHFRQLSSLASNGLINTFWPKHDVRSDLRASNWKNFSFGSMPPHIPSLHTLTHMLIRPHNTRTGPK